MPACRCAMSEPHLPQIPPPHGLMPQAVKAEAVVLKKNLRAEDAFRLVLIECLAHAAANVPAVVQGRDAEGLHQMRVALRRLQVALGLFANVFRAPKLTELRRRARRFSHALAEAREFDVLIGEMLAPMAKTIGLEAVGRLQMRAEPLRARAWARAAAEVSGAAFAEFLDEVAAAAIGFEGIKPGKVRHWPVKKLARTVLKDCRKKAMRRGRGFKRQSPAARHRLRIALKQLRYTAETFAALYGGKASVRYIGQLKTLQDGLGILNDAAGLHGLTAEHAGSYAGRIAEYQALRLGKLDKQMQHAWKGLKRLDPFWK
jgi:CHAD domain-containing protein